MPDFTYDIPLVHESTGNDPKHINISGEAVHVGISRNNYKYTSEELKRAAKTLEGKPILKDHDEKVDSIVGRIDQTEFDGNAVTFEGKVMDEKIIEMIKDGRIQNVSIGASVDDLVKEHNENGEDTERVVGLNILELSFIPIPGDPNAAISQSIAESYKRRETLMKTIKQQEPEPTPAPPAEPAEEPEEDSEEVKALKAELEALKTKLAELTAAAEQAVEEPSAEAPAAEQIGGEAPEAPAAPAESLKLKKLTEKLNKLEKMIMPKTTGIVKPTNSPKTVQEGNRTVSYDNKGKFIVEKTRAGTNFWREK